MGEKSQFKQKVKVFFEMTRPDTIFLAAAAVLLAILVGKGDVLKISVTIPAILAVACITGAGNVLNDYYDVKIDMINKPDRPLPSGRMSLKNAKRFAIMLFSVGIIFSFFLPLICILIALANSFILVFYAAVFKRSGFLGNVLVSYMVASVFIFGAATTENIIVGIFMSIIAFFSTAASEVLKDMEDVPGDKAGGAKTLPIDRGSKKTKAIVASLLILEILFSPLPFLAGVFSLYYVFGVVLADLFFIRVIMSVVKKSRIKTSWNVKLVNFGFCIALLAFFAGMIPW